MKVIGKICLLLFLGIIANLSFGQSPVLLKFKKEKVTKADFERVYQKNNGGFEAASKHTQKQYQEYLDLYVNFKRKVFEAEAMGLNKTPEFEAEYNTYKKQLAQPYLAAKDVEDNLIREAYERSKYLVNASHILLALDENAAPEDTLSVYQKIMNIRDSIVNKGSNFETMAKRYSSDPSAKDNAGNLGYFTVFEMVYPFETAAFNTPVGSVSKPVRTRFGYHIIKVIDKIPNLGTKRCAHIIVRVGDRYSAKDETQAIAKINEIYQQLKNGVKFEELAKQYSDDPGSATKGGDLGTARLRPDLEDRKLKMKKDEISEPFKTEFGWHILKVTEVTPPAEFEASKADLKRKIERDTRAQLGRQALIDKIKKENKFALNTQNWNKFKKNLTESFTKGMWSKAEYKDSSDFKLELFSLSDGTQPAYRKTLQDFVDYYNRVKPRFPKLAVAQASEAALNNFINESLLAFEEDRLPAKNPDYKALLREYHDGILLFTLMDKKVWKKAVEDTVGLKKYYEANKSSFRADEMIDVREFRTSDEETAKEVLRLLEEGKTSKYIDSLINAGSPLKIRVIAPTYEKGKNENVAFLFKESKGFRSQPVKEGDFFKIYIIEQKYPAGIKPFAKAKSECITKYQEYLEQEWLAELAKKYPVKINKKLMPLLYK